MRLRRFPSCAQLAGARLALASSPRRGGARGYRAEGLAGWRRGRKLQPRCRPRLLPPVALPLPPSLPPSQPLSLSLLSPLSAGKSDANDVNGERARGSRASFAGWLEHDGNEGTREEKALARFPSSPPPPYLSSALGNFNAENLGGETTE